MMPDILKDLREHFKVTIGFSKTKGRIKECKIFTNPMTTSSDDWSYAIAIHFANWSMLDPNEAFTKEQGEFLDNTTGRGRSATPPRPGAGKDKRRRVVCS